VFRATGYPTETERIHDAVDVSQLIVDLEGVANVLPYILCNQTTSLLFNRVFFDKMCDLFSLRDGELAGSTRARFGLQAFKSVSQVVGYPRINTASGNPKVSGYLSTRFPFFEMI
jgi:hypothetical protein